MKTLQYPELIILTIVSFATRFWHLAWPPTVVFDETHFALYASKYFSHQFYFDIHPPLGKLIFALAGWLSGGIKTNFNFTESAAYPADFNYLALRFVPALLGALLVPLVYLLVRNFNFSRRAAFIAAFLVLFDNALLVQSRLVLLDIPMIFFIVLSIFIFTSARKTPPLSRKWFILFTLCGINAGIAISIKWIGIGTLAFIWLILLSEEREVLLKNRGYTAAALFFLCFIPLAIYMAGFMLNFSLLGEPCLENCGNVFDAMHYDKTMTTYMSSELPKGNFVQKFVRYHYLMLYSTIASQTKGFYYESPWYSWPLMVRPLDYFSEKSANGYLTNILFIGNPVVWYLALIAIITVPYFLGRQYIYKKKSAISATLTSTFASRSFLHLAALYIIFFIPFSSITRYTMMYHYLSALVFSIIILAVIIDKILVLYTKKWRALILICFLLTVVFGFIYFIPLTYGFPLTEKELSIRILLPTWYY